jgi:aspartate kinase
VHLVQHSAVSTSLVVNDDPINRQSLIDDLQRWFDVKFNEGLVLYTLRHYTPTSINNLIEGTELLLEQRTRETFQVLLKNDQRTSLTLEA